MVPGEDWVRDQVVKTRVWWIKLRVWGKPQNPLLFVTVPPAGVQLAARLKSIDFAKMTACSTRAWRHIVHWVKCLHPTNIHGIYENVYMEKLIQVDLWHLGLFMSPRVNRQAKPQSSIARSLISQPHFILPEPARAENENQEALGEIWERQGKHTKQNLEKMSLFH